jgi:uncharacterized DUF497 family protein
MLGKRIVWDDRKDKANRAKHSIAFEDAANVFFDKLALTVADADHSWDELRFVTIGSTSNRGTVIVFYTETDDEIRIMSARKPTRSERLSYEEKR